ncbi:MAG: enoyl-CoA hydratase/isomerase family protein [Betaproteobacteria bacterium]|nr:enoyl-CoA hydratase/isomerase family protein [Betaproteobacteria bacterium]
MTADTVTSDKIISRKDGAIGWLIFNNPERRNAFSLEMSEAAGRVLEDFSRDNAIRVVILRGAGDKAFISGGDISKFERQLSTPEARVNWENVTFHARNLLATLEKPTIAMIRGYCLGGGMGWALNCDLRICSEDAKFGIPAAKLSIGYGADGIRQLMDHVGPSTAKEILYTARQYSAQEALRLGLVNQVVPAAELESFVRSYAEDIANNAPLAILNAKTAVNELVKDPVDRNMALVAKRAAEVTGSQDHIEGRQAFLEKRKPVFTGK